MMAQNEYVICSVFILNIILRQNLLFYFIYSVLHIRNNLHNTKYGRSYATVKSNIFVHATSISNVKFHDWRHMNGY